MSSATLAYSSIIPISCIVSASVVVELGRRLRAYHDLIFSVPVTGTIFEELFYQSVMAQFDRSMIEWHPNGHGSGVDISVSGTALSLKSAKLTKSCKNIEYSSFRTTSYKTIQEKTDFLDQNHYDHLICLGRTETRTGGMLSAVRYNLLEVKQTFHFSDLSWSEDDVNYTHAPIEDGCAVIRKSRSDQLLVTIPWKHVIELATFNVPIQNPLMQAAP